MLHAENGAALERGDRSPWTVARPGIFLYGVSTGAAAAVEPVVAVRARVVDLRVARDGETVSYYGTYHAVGDRRIATLAIGYADGIPRALGNRGYAILRGRRTLIAGVVTMDMTMIDVTGVDVEVGDTATLIGADGELALSVTDVAEVIDMSPYELLTGLRGRLVRRYV
jgi:alanine racemase